MPASVKLASELVEEGTTLTQYLLSVSRERVNSLEGEVRHSAPEMLSSKPNAQDGVLDLITLLQSIKLAVQEVGWGREMVRAPRLPIEGDERSEVLAVIQAGIAGRPDLD